MVGLLCAWRVAAMGGKPMARVQGLQPASINQACDISSFQRHTAQPVLVKVRATMLQPPPALGNTLPHCGLLPPAACLRLLPTSMSCQLLEWWWRMLLHARSDLLLRLGCPGKFKAPFCCRTEVAHNFRT